MTAVAAVAFFATLHRSKEKKKKKATAAVAVAFFAAL
jgi:hypothetical protein